MKLSVTHCARCGLRLSPQDVATGEALAFGATLFCKGCAPAPAPAPRPRQPAPATGMRPYPPAPSGPVSIPPWAPPSAPGSGGYTPGAMPRPAPPQSSGPPQGWNPGPAPYPPARPPSPATRPPFPAYSAPPPTAYAPSPGFGGGPGFGSAPAFGGSPAGYNGGGQAPPWAPPGIVAPDTRPDSSTAPVSPSGRAPRPRERRAGDKPASESGRPVLWIVAGGGIIVAVLLGVALFFLLRTPGIDGTSDGGHDQQLLDDARAWAKDNPDDLAGQASHYKEVAEKATDTTVTQEAARLRDEAQRGGGSAARKAADDMLGRARDLENKSDLESACLALETVPPVVRQDEDILKEVKGERDRLTRKRCLARARDAIRRYDGDAALEALRALRESPETADEAKRLRSDAERLIAARASRPPESDTPTVAPTDGGGGGGGGRQQRPQQPQQREPTRDEWVAQCLKVSSCASEAEFLEKRKAALAAQEKLGADWQKGATMHEIAMLPDQRGFKGSNITEDGNVLDKADVVKAIPGDPRQFMYLMNPNQSRLEFQTRAAPRTWKHIALRIHHWALAPDFAKEFALGLLSIAVNGKPVTTYAGMSSDPTSVAVVEITEQWQPMAVNKVSITLGMGLCRVMIEKVEVVVQD